MGPPGNGKTISLKAVMKNSTNPVLYVKNFTSECLRVVPFTALRASRLTIPLRQRLDGR